MSIKLFNSELKVMDVLWRAGDTPARRIAQMMTDNQGWNINTTYTIINRCIKKKAMIRLEPGFLCHAAITKAEVQEAETNELINRLYDGSVDEFFSVLLNKKNLSQEQIMRVRQIIEEQGST